MYPLQYRWVKSKGAPGLAFETWDPSNQFPLETPTLLFVIRSSRLAEASRERNDTAKIAIDVRPGGPTAKRQPSPEGLGNRSRRGSERRRRGTKPIVRSPCVVGSEADLSRRAVEGSAVPRIFLGNV